MAATTREAPRTTGDDQGKKIAAIPLPPEYREDLVVLDNLDQQLINARSSLAEKSVAARRGHLFKDADATGKELKEATGAYQKVLNEYLDSRLEAIISDINNTNKASLSRQNRKELAAQIAITEAGLLQGEEVNWYLTVEDGKYARFLRWYNSQSGLKRGAIGVAAGIPIGLAASSLVGAGIAAVGAVAGYRWGRGYVNREASRQDKGAKTAAKTAVLNENKRKAERGDRMAVNDDGQLVNPLEQVEKEKAGARNSTVLQRRATFKKFNHDYYQNHLTTPYNLAAEGRKKKGEKYTHHDDANVLSERIAGKIVADDKAAIEAGEAEVREKRISAAWGLGGVAVGATLGYLLGEAAEELWERSFGVDPDIEEPDLPPEVEERIEDLEESLEDEQARSQELEERVVDLEETAEQQQETIESQGETIEEQRETIADQDEVIESQQERIQALEQETARLEAEKEALEERLAESETAPDAEAVPIGVPEDISNELGLPDGYIIDTVNGYEVTAMRGGQTDSIWRAAEHSLRHYLRRQPSVFEIDALQDMLGTHWLNVGDKVVISDEQIERALEIATAYH